MAKTPNEFTDDAFNPLNTVGFPRQYMPDDWSISLKDDYDGKGLSFTLLQNTTKALARSLTFQSGSLSPVTQVRSNLSRLYCQFDQNGNFIGLYSIELVENAEDWKELIPNTSPIRVGRSVSIIDAIIDSTIDVSSLIRAGRNDLTLVYHDENDLEYGEHRLLLLPVTDIPQYYHLNIINENSEPLQVSTVSPEVSKINGADSVDVKSNVISTFIFNSPHWSFLRYPEAIMVDSPLTGTAAPATTLDPNDSLFYYDLTGLQLYFKSSELSSWQAVGGMQNQPLFGTGAPPQSLIPNDSGLYFDTTNNILYFRNLNTAGWEPILGSIGDPSNPAVELLQDSPATGAVPPADTLDENKSYLYYDTAGEKLWIRTPSATAWNEVAIDDPILEGAGIPTGVVSSNRSRLYYDRALAKLWFSSREGSRTSWININPDVPVVTPPTEGVVVPPSTLQPNHSGLYYDQIGNAVYFHSQDPDVNTGWVNIGGNQRVIDTAVGSFVVTNAMSGGYLRWNATQEAITNAAGNAGIIFNMAQNLRPGFTMVIKNVTRKINLRLHTDNPLTAFNLLPAWTVNPQQAVMVVVISATEIQVSSLGDGVEPKFSFSIIDELSQREVNSRGDQATFLKDHGGGVFEHIDRFTLGNIAGQFHVRTASRSLDFVTTPAVDAGLIQYSGDERTRQFRLDLRVSYYTSDASTQPAANNQGQFIAYLSPVRIREIVAGSRLWRPYPGPLIDTRYSADAEPAAASGAGRSNPGRGSSVTTIELEKDDLLGFYFIPAVALYRKPELGGFAWPRDQTIHTGNITFIEFTLQIDPI